MSRILIIDDDEVFLDTVRSYVGERFPGLIVQTCGDAVHCLTSITADIDLLLVDLEMPGLDGTKVLSYAVSRGVDRNRVIILSGRDAEYLHQRFPPGSCLGVLNKFEARQQEALDMIFAALQKNG